MKKSDKLHAYWSKKYNDMTVCHPLGAGTRSDARYLLGIFNREFEKQMADRGYNVKTIKFSIEPMALEGKFRSARVVGGCNNCPYIDVGDNKILLPIPCNECDIPGSIKR